MLPLGKEIFTTNCVSCNDLKNDGIGARLAGAIKIRSQKQLTSFIQNPAKVVESGEKRAGILSRKYKLIMPSFDFLKMSDIKALLAYIDHETVVENIEPLEAIEDKDTAGKPQVRFGTPVTKSGLKIELEDFIQIPASD